MTSTGDPVPSAGTVALVTLGCARNEVDSEELAGRLAAAGWEVVDDAETADAVLVNTCGFVDVAKKDSIDAILAASDVARDRSVPGTVVAVGCLAERYGRDLADELPEADAVLGFDDYPDIADRLRRIVQGERPVAHTPPTGGTCYRSLPSIGRPSPPWFPGTATSWAPRRPPRAGSPRCCVVGSTAVPWPR
ncbi:MAG: hypothetical protein U0R65_04395 [Candidatus Nanopelagicales bacterium]